MKISAWYGLQIEAIIGENRISGVSPEKCHGKRMNGVNEVM